MTPPVQQLAPDDERLWSLAASMCDGTITEQDRDLLESTLRTSDSARLFFAAYMDLHGRMLWRFRGGDRDASAAGSLRDRPVPFVEPPTPSLPTGFLASALHGVAGYVPEGMPFACLVSMVVLCVGLFVASVVYVSHPVQLARESDSLPSPLSPLPSVVGRITGMVDCRWGNRGLGIGDWGLEKGSRFKVQGSQPRNFQSPIPNPQSLVCLGDKIALSAGLMEITYTTGAKVILQGPVVYEADSKDGGYLSLGKLTARLETKAEGGGRRAEEVASGQWLVTSKSEIRHQKSEIPNPSLSTTLSPLFTIKTPTAVVTDLGTEFGVEVSEEGATQVHVLQGIVEARGAGRMAHAIPAKLLRKGMAVEIGPTEKVVKAVTFAPRSFTRNLQPTVTSAAETAYMKAVLMDKPMGYWPLDEPAGSRTFLDRSGNGIIGYAMGKPVAGQPGPLGDHSRALALNGDSYIDFGSCNRFAMENDFTVEAWAWIGDVARSGYVISAVGRTEKGYHGWGLIAGRDRTGAKDPENVPLELYLIVQQVGHFAFPLREGEDIQNRWRHVAVAFDRNNTAQLYLDGEHRGSVTHGAPSVLGPVWVDIGCAEPIDADLWRGRLAHVAVYPRALGAEQIQNHYNQRLHGGKEAPDKQR